MAAQNGHTSTVEKQIAAGADVDKATTTNGSTPLWIAAQSGHPAIVSKLLQHGADTSIRGWHDETPLEAAQRNNHAAVTTLLA
jgi:ankyrin repeat protein